MVCEVKRFLHRRADVCCFLPCTRTEVIIPLCPRAGSQPSCPELPQASWSLNSRSSQGWNLTARPTLCDSVRTCPVRVPHGPAAPALMLSMAPFCPQCLQPQWRQRKQRPALKHHRFSTHPTGHRYSRGCPRCRGLGETCF
jgi:hypothetical protein